MSEMIERAAKAIRESMGPVFGNPEYLAKPGNVERLEARQQSAAETHARLALFAALNPEDEDAREAVAEALYRMARFTMPGVVPRSWKQFAKHEPADANMFRDQGAAAIAALKAAAQGGPTP